ncbi:MAG: SRPBCC domain-containing protein [Candidatus Hydrogenedentes bacterium]|nr:SRPBCC domain-containing protein [Candidatus Hydrogenedentota bacterium]
MAITLDNQTTITPDGVIEITRVFDVPREVVWKAWTDADELQRWWGPMCFTCPASRIDLRVGGTYHHCMRAPDGKDYWSTGTYKEIVPLERIAATDSFADEKGNVVSAADIGMGDAWPLEMHFTIKFEDLGGRTQFRIQHQGIPEGPVREMCAQGWNESFDKMADCLSNA